MPPEQLPPQVPPRFNFLETDPKKNFAPWFIVFCIFLILAILAIGGFFLYKDFMPFPNTTPKQEESITTWQTYRHEGYGYEIKVPAGWEIKTDKAYTSNYTYLETVDKSSENYASITILPTGELDHGLPSEEPETSQISIADISANQRDWGNFAIIKFNSPPKPSWSTEGRIEIVFGNKKELVQEILSTFKFIEPIPADWKTYRNESYGYEVKYPPHWIVSSAPNDIHLSSNDKEFGPRTSIEFNMLGTKPANVKLIDQLERDSKIYEMGVGGPFSMGTFNGYEAVISESHGGEGPSGPGYMIETSPNTYLHIFVYLGSSEPETNQVLSSFKFITPTTTPPPTTQEPIACTADAMMCPDGSYVGRSGPNCQFVCP